MTEAEREELRESARVNLTTHLGLALNFINGPYRNDPDACRGMIWDCIEAETEE